jgi:hypothetical protein
MSDSPLDLDLKFLPDWLKEPANKNPYADFAGDSSDRDSHRGQSGRGDDRRRSGGGRHDGPQNRQGGGQGRQGAGGGQNRGPQNFQGNKGGQNRAPHGGGGQNRSSQPGGQNRPSAPNTASVESISIPVRDPNAPPRPPLPGREARLNREQKGNNRGPGGRQDSRDSSPENRGDRPPRQGNVPPTEQPTVNLHVEILPEESGIAALAKQIKSGIRAYPLYGLGRMFLNKPERHRVKITAPDDQHLLFQLGDEGMISLNKNALDREAFRASKANYYTEEKLQLEVPKGNFTSVARCRISGVLLGPTSHHGYQPALRRLYDSRFSRRMDFQEFLRQIELVNDPAVVEEWKTQVSTSTIYRTTQLETPLEFKSPQEVEAHFRQTYLPELVLSSKTVEISGTMSRDVNDRDIRNAIRNAWEKERGFPSQIVNQIRPHFLDAGLHIWKHRKRILFVSTVRPVRFGTDTSSVSQQISDLLSAVEATPKCTKADLSARLLKPHEESEDFPKVKAALASDLHWLISSGHIIEFHDGTLDLPLLPKELAKEAQDNSKPDVQAETESAAAFAAETQARATPAPVPVADTPAAVSATDTSDNLEQTAAEEAHPLPSASTAPTEEAPVAALQNDNAPEEPATEAATPATELEAEATAASSELPPPMEAAPELEKGASA